MDSPKLTSGTVFVRMLSNLQAISWQIYVCTNGISSVLWFMGVRIYERWALSLTFQPLRKIISNLVKRARKQEKWGKINQTYWGVYLHLGTHSEVSGFNSHIWIWSFYFLFFFLLQLYPLQGHRNVMVGNWDPMLTLTCALVTCWGFQLSRWEGSFVKAPNPEVCGNIPVPRRRGRQCPYYFISLGNTEP